MIWKRPCAPAQTSASNKRESFYALVFGWCRQYDRALEIYSRTGTSGYFGYQNLALLHLGRGDFTNFMRFSKEALLTRAKRADPVNAQFEALNKAFQQGGKQKYWELSLKFESSRGDLDHLMRKAAHHAQLHQPEEAFRYLRRAMREEPLCFIGGFYTNPSFDSLRAHKEFVAIEKELWWEK